MQMTEMLIQFIHFNRNSKQKNRNNWTILALVVFSHFYFYPTPNHGPLNDKLKKITFKMIIGKKLAQLGKQAKNTKKKIIIVACATSEHNFGGLQIFNLPHSFWLLVLMANGVLLPVPVRWLIKIIVSCSFLHCFIYFIYCNININITPGNFCCCCCFINVQAMDIRTEGQHWPTKHIIMNIPFGLICLTDQCVNQHFYLV